MSHHTKSTRSRRLVNTLAVAGALGATAAGGLAYQARATAQDRQRLSPPGRMVDAGGHRLHLLTMGEAHAGPTVVLEAGGMATSPMWALIQPAIAEFARVVSYDRAGLGWSEPGPMPRDARTIADELHTVLRNAELPGPYVLVGGSLGGPYATVFADAFRVETAALVLVDSVHPDQLQRMPPQAQRAIAALKIANRLLPAVAAVGLTHLVDVTGVLLAGLPSKLPADAAAQLRAFAHWPGFWAAVDAEVTVWDTTMDQMRQAMHGGRLKDLPMAVLTAPDNPGMEALREPWLDMQRELVGVSDAATHHVVEGAGHIAMATEPEPIRTLVGVVRGLVVAGGNR